MPSSLRVPSLLLAASSVLTAGCLAPRLSSPPAHSAQAAAPSREDSIGQALRGVVRVRVESSEGAESFGTGFVVAASGIVATNRHVIGDAADITVDLADGRSLEPAHVVDPESADDLAFLLMGVRLDGEMRLRSEPPARPGEDVYALGHPMGLDNTVTEGIVSSIRMMDGVPFIQTSAPISFGNSGGPLIDGEGRVIGVVTWKLVAGGVEGLAFATPVSRIRALLEVKQDPLTAQAYYQQVRSPGERQKHRRRQILDAPGMTKDFAGAWSAPGDPVHLGLTRHGDEVSLGSIVLLKDAHALGRPAPEVLVRRDFVVAPDAAGTYRGQVEWPWPCTPVRPVRDHEGRWIRPQAKECGLPTDFEMHGVRGGALVLTLTRPHVPSASDADYDRACETCLTGAGRRDELVALERVSSTVFW